MNHSTSQTATYFFNSLLVRKLDTLGILLLLGMWSWNPDRLCLRQCFSTKIRTSASVTSSIRPGIMIGRGNGRDQFGAGNAVSSSRKRNHYYLQNVVGGGKASVRCRLAHRLGPSKKFSRG